MGLLSWKTNMEKNCPFCLENLNSDILLENNSAYVIFDKFPVSKGHVLVVPKIHTSNFFDISQQHQEDLLALVNQAKKHLDCLYKPDGYNVGINVNEVAGQTVWHVHVHLIPRYKGDVEQPRGGVRGVIPGKQNY